jgi:hypothetical protein
VDRDKDRKTTSKSGRAWPSLIHSELLRIETIGGNSSVVPQQSHQG